ncbi:methylaspartate mutase subunit S [Haloplasma contractile]|uniref:Glutamate mutase sigma subunit n=1 Tax=Haloplasma contractile SSD-17B TaxID=1033810 RepID=U2FSD8_9MOLU|nr:methylaspartate mutase subunit S [Haloplasma contractile]ERJ13854.1 Methylaspartate mutase S chain protein [Haloplasma contractile SSD-17B]
MEGKTIVIGVIGSDVHAVGNKIIDHALTKSGFNVVNVGVLSTQEDFINAAVETNASAILVSSLYGHGEIDAQGMRDKCNEAGLDDILLYIGGNVVVGKQDFEEVEQRFKDLGFDRVYEPGQKIEDGIKDLKKDLNLH